MSSTSTGKQRQLSNQSSERTPLLPTERETDTPQNRNAFSNLTISLFIAGVFTMALLVLLHLYAGSLISRDWHPQLIAEKGFKLDSVDAIRFSNKKDQEKVLVELDVQVAFDTEAGLEWQNPQSWLQRMESWAAKQVVKNIKSTEITFSHLLISTNDSEDSLVKISSLPIDLPLSYGLPLVPESRTLTSKIEVLQGKKLGQFIKQSWEKQTINLKARVEGVEVIIGNGWNRFIGPIKIASISNFISQKLPNIGNASSFIEISFFSVLPSPLPDKLSILATINLTNPLPSLHWSNPYQVPFNIHLPSNLTERILLAKVDVSPFEFNKEGQKEVMLAGQVIFPAEDSKISFERSLSTFVKSYLAGDASTVFISYDSITHSAIKFLEPPAFLGQILEDIEVLFQFPGSTSKLEFFKDLKIERMKISLSPESDSTGEGEPDLLMSGIITGTLLLPSFLSTLSTSLFLTQILPDLFIYSGIPVNTQDHSYPPSPYPSNSFARLLPSSKITTNTYHGEDGKITFRAEVKEAPLYLLRGRESVFQSYMAKVLLSGGRGVMTGIRGISGVDVSIRNGLEQEVGLAIGLEGIEIEGSFLVGG